MTFLIACISSGKGTLAHVAKVIADEEWEKIILIANEENKNFKSSKPAEIFVINPNKSTSEISEDIRKALQDKLKGQLEVGVNFISGSGKEHMALISALLKLGVGFRLTALTRKGVREI